MPDQASAPLGKEQLDTLVESLLATPRDARPGSIPGPVEQTLTSIMDRAAELAIADTPRAERAAGLVIELADELGLSSVGARARVTLGHVLNYATRFEASLAVLGEAAALGTSVGDGFAVARAALVSMHALARLGRMSEAIAAGSRAIQGFSAVNEPTWRAKADVNLGVLKRMQDDALGALEHFESARPVFSGAPAVLAQIESNRAEALLDLARFDEARGAFETALASFLRAGATHAAGIAQGNLADLLSRQGRLEQALVHFESARRLLEAVGAPADLARLLSEEGDALAAIGMDEEAVESYARAIAALDAAGLVAEGARARVGQSRPLERLGRFADADAALGAAITALAGIPSSTACARAAVRRASILLAVGRGRDALEAVEGAMADLHERPADRAAALVVRAGVLVAMGRASEGDRDAQEALDLALRLGMTPLVCDAHAARARALVDLGRDDEAIDALHRAIEAAERVRGSLQADRFRAAALASRHQVYEQAIAALLRRASVRAGSGGADVATAFELADRARARALLDLVHGGVELAEQLASGVTPADAALLRELSQHRSAMSVLYDRAFGGDPVTSGPSPRGGDAGAALEVHERRIVEIERRLAAVRRFQAFSPSPVTSDQARSMLRPSEALVEYVAIEGALHALVARPGEPIAVERLASQAAVAEMGERLQLAIDRAVAAASRGVGSATGARPAAADPTTSRLLTRLHDALIGPVEHHLRGVGRLLVSPHDTLYALPFHAFMRQGEPLVQRMEVVVAPSAALVWHARSSPVARATGLPLVVGVPDEVAPEMGDEARAVASALGSARLLVGTDATFEEFTSHVGDAPLVHLACHGVFSSRNPMQARLRFSDAWVTVRDIFGLSFPGSVVVLSGCETGRAGVTRGDEAYGLGRALLAAGASCVVMSLWPVHDRTTRELMESVYQSLGRGYLSGEKPPGDQRGGGVADVVGLLAQVQRGLIARGVHPALWAPFVVMGEPT